MKTINESADLDGVTWIEPRRKQGPVSVRAIEARLRRKLAKDGLAMRRARSQQAELELGEIFLIDVQRNAIVRTECTLEGLAREWNAIGAHEKIIEE